MRQKQIQKAWKIVVGCDDYTPFSYMDVNGNQTRIDVELATEAFHRMGYEPDFTFINWEEKKDLLKDGTIEVKSKEG
ncbi:transporter substrate-binding domain-containing protein, partial [Salmonella enterica]|uniref:transporter substrate-binding domain-containing protein n=1 Tax=Salmonella enterica TaxID=28901 RepID=UPI0020C2583F